MTERETIKKIKAIAVDRLGESSTDMFTITLLSFIAEKLIDIDTKLKRPAEKSKTRKVRK